ncbi:HEAT repeat domain-containing protein, partial [Planktothrix agardhii]
METNTKFNGFYSAKLALLCLSMVLLFGGKTQTQAMTTTAVIDQLQKLTDTNRQNRLEAIKTLKTLGSPAIPILVEALTDDQESIRRGAAFALGAMAQDAVDAVPALLATLKDPVSAVRMDGAVALKQITTASPEALQQAVQELTPRLNHPDTAVRQGAALGLGVIGSESPNTIPPLIGALKDTDEEVRLAAAIALKRMGAVAVPALKEALNHPDMGVRARAAFALGNIQASGI